MPFSDCKLTEFAEDCQCILLASVFYGQISGEKHVYFSHSFFERAGIKFGKFIIYTECKLKKNHNENKNAFKIGYDVCVRGAVLPIHTKVTGRVSFATEKVGRIYYKVAENFLEKLSKIMTWSFPTPPLVVNQF